MPFNGWIIKQSVVWPYNEILHSSKKKWNIDTQNSLDKLQNLYSEWEKPDLNALYYSILLYDILKVQYYR